MHSKRFSIAAILLALLLAFSFALVMFAGCVKEGDDDSGDTPGGPDGPGTGDEGDPNEAAVAKLVTDESLKEKLLVLYDFEDPSRSSGSALYGYDPFTGAPNSRNGVYSSTGDAQTVTTSSLEAQVTGSSSKTALNVTSGVTLNGALEGLFDADFDGQDANGGYDKGVSVSFWAYNYDMNKQESSETAGTLSWDYNNIVSNGIISVTYGNLRGSTPSGTDALVYPSATTTVGRAAYTEESYNARRNLAGMTDTTMQTFDASATDPYTGWNAIAGNVQTAEEGSVVYEIGESYYQNWRYITVSLQPDGVYFYNNGRLAYAYTSLSNIEWSTNSSIFNRTCSQYYRYIAAINAEEYSVSGQTVGLAQLGYQFGMFGIETGIYADDLIVGYGLDADDARALYEDVSGVEYTDDQVACTSAASQEDQAENDAKNAAVKAWVAKTIDSYAVEGDVWGPGSAGSPGVAGKDENNDGVITDVIGTMREEFLADFDASAYEAVLGKVDCSATAQLDSDYSFTPDTVEADGSFEMTISGIQLTPGQNNWEAAYINLYSGDTRHATTRIDWYAPVSDGWADWSAGLVNTIGGAITWVDATDNTNGVYLNVVQRFCYLDIVVTFDGSTRYTLTYNVYYPFLGQTVTLDAGEYGEFEYTFTKADALFNHITHSITAEDGKTLAEIIDPATVNVRIGYEKSAYIVTGTEGCTMHEPEAAE